MSAHATYKPRSSHWTYAEGTMVPVVCRPISDRELINLIMSCNEVVYKVPGTTEIDTSIAEFCEGLSRTRERRRASTPTIWDPDRGSRSTLGFYPTGSISLFVLGGGYLPPHRVKSGAAGLGYVEARQLLA